MTVFITFLMAMFILPVLYARKGRTVPGRVIVTISLVAAFSFYSLRVVL